MSELQSIYVGTFLNILCRTKNKIGYNLHTGSKNVSSLIISDFSQTTESDNNCVEFFSLQMFKSTHKCTCTNALNTKLVGGVGV